MPRRLIAPITAVVLALSACGGDDGPDLSAEAEAGRSVFRSNGCSSCHGANGQGGVGPSFEGLYGSEVELDDGSIVVADDAYLRESITDPSAKIVDGYGVRMPTNNLGDDDIDQIIAFIAELGDVSP
jgi:mono/diheme cytochrome c family protein